MYTVMTYIDMDNINKSFLDHSIEAADYLHANFHLHSCVYDEHIGSIYDLENSQLIEGGNRILQGIQCEAEAVGIKSSASIGWCSSWEKSLFDQLEKIEDPIVFAEYPDTHYWQRWKPSHALNQLVRLYPCPVMMVKRDKWTHQTALVLLGPEMNTTPGEVNEPSMRLLINAIDYGKELEEVGFDVYYVCSYPDSYHFPDRSKLLSHTGSNNDRIIFRWGKPEEVVPPLIKSLQIDMLAIMVSTSPAFAQHEQQYLQKIGQQVDCDIMVVH